MGKVKLQGNRKECGCFASRDIGAYDTCPHGCVYCYAVQQRDVALRRFKEHDPGGEFLFPPVLKNMSLTKCWIRGYWLVIGCVLLCALVFDFSGGAY